MGLGQPTGQTPSARLTALQCQRLAGVQCVFGKMAKFGIHSSLFMLRSMGHCIQRVHGLPESCFCRNCFRGDAVFEAAHRARLSRRMLTVCCQSFAGRLDPCLQTWANCKWQVDILFVESNCNWLLPFLSTC